MATRSPMLIDIDKVSSDTPPDPTPILFGDNTYTPSPAYAQRVQAEQAPEQPAGYGVWPHLIAVAAAAKGNFGPAFTITEQNRKTAL